MTRYISVTETAKLVRAALKDNFKGIKFSVRSSSYAGGASIDVSWVDGPCMADVDRVVKGFQGATFDSSIDLKSYVTGELNGEEVHFGTDYVMTHRKTTYAFVEAIAMQFCQRFGLPLSTITFFGNANDTWANTTNLDYSQERWFHDLLHNTDAKDMYRAYAAEDEKEARQQAEYEAYVKQEEKERAEAQAKAEREAKEREQAEFSQWQSTYLQNEAWQRQQFALWKVEQERLAREEAARQEAKRQAEEKAERARQQREQEEQARRQREQQQRERINGQKRTILASKASALAYFGLSVNASRNAVLVAFRSKVKASSDGKGGYVGDMDLLVKAKEMALR